MPRDLYLEKAFHPKAIAIVGVSRNDVDSSPDYTGLKILRLLQGAGFEGHLYPINPSAGVVAGVKAYTQRQVCP